MSSLNHKTKFWPRTEEEERQFLFEQRRARAWDAHGRTNWYNGFFTGVALCIAGGLFVWFFSDWWL